MTGRQHTKSKSMWSYNPLPSSCVLYLPLWHPSFRPSSFQSLCGRANFTVVGATRGSNCLVFDGDDYLRYVVPLWNPSASQGSVIVWFKGSDVAASQTLVSSSDEDVTSSYITFGLDNAGKMRLAVKSAVSNVLTGDTDLTDNTWHMVTFVSSSTAYKLYKDAGVDDGLNVIGGTDSGEWFADVTPARDNLTIGTRYRTTADDHLTGSIGEVMICNAVLSSTKIATYHNKTKRRYL